MSAGSFSVLDLIVLLIFLFSTFVLVKSWGWKKGGLYLGFLLLVGASIAIVTSLLDSFGKYVVAVLIVLMAFFWGRRSS